MTGPEWSPSQIGSFTIASDKITRYLLNPLHPRGRTKAAFFVAFGFDETRPDELAQALFRHIHSADSAITTAPHPLGYGLNVKVIGPLRAPDGRVPMVQALWLVNPTSSEASLVTAYPAPP